MLQKSGDGGGENGKRRRGKGREEKEERGREGGEGRYVPQNKLCSLVLIAPIYLYIVEQVTLKAIQIMKTPCSTLFKKDRTFLFLSTVCHHR